MDELSPLPAASSRGTQSLADVYSSDRDAVEDWLRTVPAASGHTARAYRQAVADLWRWLRARHVLQLDGGQGGQAPDLPGDVLIRLTTGQAQAYVQDLQRPTGARPALAATTVRHRVAILGAMYAYWLTPREQGRSIVAFNPFAQLARLLPRPLASNRGAQRALSRREQEVVEQTLAALPENTRQQKLHKARAQLIWLLATRLGLRRAEIANLKVNHFRISTAGGDSRWILDVRGKGRRDNESPDLVVVPTSVMRAIHDYREATGTHAQLLPSDAGPLLKRVAGTSARFTGLSESHLGRIMKTIFGRAAELAERELREYHLATRLRDASIHWGRHTFFMNALQKHDLQLVSRAGRHRDIRTTMQSYVGTAEDDLAKVMGD